MCACWNCRNYPSGTSAEPLQDSVTQCRSWNVFFHGTTRFLGLSFPFSHCTEDPQRTVILATGHGYSYVFPCKTLENNGPGYISVPIFSVLCQRWEHTSHSRVSEAEPFCRFVLRCRNNDAFMFTVHPQLDKNVKLMTDRLMHKSGAQTNMPACI